MRLSAILCAAGLSGRMGRDKLLMKYQGRTLMQRAVDLLSALPVDQRIIVSISERVSRTEIPQETEVYINATPEEGLSGSIRIGTSAASGTHYLYLASDQPDLTPGDIIPMIELINDNPDKIIYPFIASEPQSPVIFPEIFRPQLISLTGDTGGRGIRDANPERCLIYTPPIPANFRDIDTMNDFS